MDNSGITNLRVGRLKGEEQAISENPKIKGEGAAGGEGMVPRERNKEVEVGREPSLKGLSDQ